MSSFLRTIKNSIGLAIPVLIALYTAYMLLKGIYLGEISAPPLGRVHSNTPVFFADEPSWYLICCAGWLLASAVFARISWVVLQSIRKPG